MRSALVILLVLCLGHSEALAQSGQDVLDRIRSRYESLEALRARFSQTLITPDGREGEVITGTLILQGDRYRLETPEQTIVNDGEVVWIYNAPDNQVLINDYVEDETTFSLNRFLFHLEDDYEIVSTGRALLGGKDHLMVRLKPRSPETYFREIMVVMREADNLVTRIEVTDMNDTKLVFDLRDIELNPTLEPDVFTFQPPQGTEVIDLRSD